MTSGNPQLARMAKLDRRLDEHDGRLDDHERRLVSVEAELREVNRDIATLTDVVIRSRLRAGDRLRALRRSRRRPLG